MSGGPIDNISVYFHEFFGMNFGYDYISCVIFYLMIILVLIIMRFLGLSIIPRNQLGKKTRRTRLSRELMDELLERDYPLRYKREIYVRVIYSEHFEWFIRRALSRGFFVEVILEPGTYDDEARNRIKSLVEDNKNINLYVESMPLRHGILIGDDLILEDLHGEILLDSFKKSMYQRMRHELVDSNGDFHGSVFSKFRRYVRYRFMPREKLWREYIDLLETRMIFGTYYGSIILIEQARDAHISKFNRRFEIIKYREERRG